MANSYVTIGNLGLVTSLADTNKLLIDDSTGGDTKAAEVSTLKQYLINAVTPQINLTTRTWWVNGVDTGVLVGVDFTQLLQSTTTTPVQDGNGKIQYNVRLSSQANNLLEIDTTNGGLYAKNNGPGVIRIWATGETYGLNDFVCYNNIVYRCTTVPSQFDTFDLANWTPISMTISPYTDTEITTMITAVWG